MDFSSEFLVESKSAREEGIVKLKIQHSEQKILNKAKQLLFAVWKDKTWTTRQQLAEFYEVPVATIDSNYKRHTEEFESDGVEVFRGFDLKEVRGIMPLTSSTPQETIYTSAGALRMGFILRDSEVAKTVRTIAIRFIQGIGQVDNKLVLQALTQSYPVLNPFIERQALKVSAPLARYWDKMKSTLRKNYPQGGVTYRDTNGNVIGKKSDEVRKDIQFLASYTDNFKLQGIKELSYELADEVRVRLPALTSDILNFDVADGLGSAVIMFQFDSVIVDVPYVEDCVARGYIQLAKEKYQVDQAYLFLVAPFGATSYAESYIKTRLPIEHQGCVAVLTVKELTEFLYREAMVTRRDKKHPAAKGELTAEFNILLNYPFPIIPEIFDQPSLFDASPENKLLS